MLRSQAWKCIEQIVSKIRIRLQSAESKSLKRTSSGLRVGGWTAASATRYDGKLVLINFKLTNSRVTAK